MTVYVNSGIEFLLLTQLSTGNYIIRVSEHVIQIFNLDLAKNYSAIVHYLNERPKTNIQVYPKYTKNIQTNIQ